MTATRWTKTEHYNCPVSGTLVSIAVEWRGLPDFTSAERKLDAVVGRMTYCDRASTCGQSFHLVNSSCPYKATLSNSGNLKTS